MYSQTNYTLHMDPTYDSANPILSLYDPINLKTHSETKQHEQNEIIQEQTCR